MENYNLGKYSLPQLFNLSNQKSLKSVINGPYKPINSKKNLTNFHRNNISTDIFSTPNKDNPYKE